jgi:hypothetical protein
LWVEDGKVRTYDQVKFRSQGRWTPARLRSDGVLAKLRVHYVTGHQILLVLSQPSEELEHLIALARATASGAELWANAPDTNDLALLQDAWGATKDQTRAFLTQTSVRHDGLSHMREFVGLALEMLVLDDPSLAVGALREFLDRNVATTFSAPHVWSALEARNVRRRPRLEPGPAANRVRDALDRHVRAVQHAVPSAGPIHRDEVTNIVDAVTSTASPVILVVGKAGAGKSVVVSEAAEELSRRGRHVAALRLDRLDPQTSTAAALGQSIALERSPVLVLSEISPAGMDGVLVIDQLDAVSSYSGRMPSVFEAVDEALTQARLIGNVKVILAVREIDLREDPRLRQLAGDNVPEIPVGELDDDAIREYLPKLGTDIAELSASTLQLLRLPIYLYVFSELAPEMRTAQYETLASLYSAYTKNFRVRLELLGHPDEWPQVSQILIERMNTDEALSVPASLLERVRPLYVEALISANVLVKEEGRLALFHETYFDYLFAQSFMQRNQELVAWFAASGQGLFRRSQLRQLLAYIASVERDKFVDQVMAIVESSLRPHLVSIAYTALAGIEPNAKDWSAIRPLMNSGDEPASQVLSLLGSPKWFRVADETGDIERFLDDPDWRDSVSSITARLAGDMPGRVLELLRHRRTRGDLWVRAIRMAIDVADSPEWTNFALEQSQTGGLDLDGDPFEIDATSLFYRLRHPHPELALRLVTVTLSAAIERAMEQGSEGLLTAIHEWGRRTIDATRLDELASAAGPVFVAEMLPLIEKLALHTAPGGRELWSYRLWGRHRTFEDELFFAFDGQLSSLAREDPSQAIPLLDRMNRHQNDALNFLVCRAMHYAPVDYAADWLLETESHRSIGWLNSTRWESRRLIAHVSQTCSDDRFSALEMTLLNMQPPVIEPKYWVRHYGFAELELLSAMSSERLSPPARRRVAELERKFPWWEPSEPEGISGGFVQSPIPQAAGARMTDAQWLRAIQKYDRRDKRTFDGGEAFGGTDELANMMGLVAKDDPARYLALALEFSAEISPAYTDHVIRNLAGEIGQFELLPLLIKFGKDHPEDSGRVLASAIDTYADDLSDDLFHILLGLATHPDPSDELARVETGSGYYYGGDFASAGLNSTRGLVARTLARALFANHSRLPESRPVVLQLVEDPVIAVRVMTTELTLAYASIDQAGGLDLIERLLGEDLVLESPHTARSLRWAMLWDADRFAPYLDRALQVDQAQSAGAVWANCLVNDALGSLVRHVGDLSENARLGAAEAISAVPAMGIDLLVTLASDTSDRVRKQASLSLHQLGDLSPEDQSILIAGFLTDIAVSDAMGDLVGALKDLHGELPDITMETCTKVLGAIKSSKPRAGAVFASDLVAVLVRLYRAGDKTEREAALDLIDETVLLRLWRVDDVLDDAR